MSNTIHKSLFSTNIYRLYHRDNRFLYKPSWKYKSVKKKNEKKKILTLIYTNIVYKMYTSYVYYHRSKNNRKHFSTNNENIIQNLYTCERLSVYFTIMNQCIAQMKDTLFFFIIKDIFDKNTQKRQKVL